MPGSEPIKITGLAKCSATTPLVVSAQVTLDAHCCTVTALPRFIDAGDGRE